MSGKPQETINDLRANLFAVLADLADKSKPADIERARAVADIAQTLVNTMKVEVETIKITGGSGSGFIPELNTIHQGATVKQIGGARIITNRLPG